MFPVEDLRQAVEMAKIILTKEKLYRQLAGQLSSTPFMNIWGGYNSNKKTVSFDTQDRLDDKIDKLASLMSKCQLKEVTELYNLSPNFIKEKGEDKVEIIMTKVDIKVDINQTMEIDTVDCHIEVDLSTDKFIEKGLSMFKIMEEILGEEILEKHITIEVKISEENIEVVSETSNLDRGRSRSREGQFLGNFRRNDRSSRSRSGSRASTNIDGIRCFKCREYDHFAKDCPYMLETEKDQTEQMKQMLDSEEHETTLKVLTPDTYEGLISTH